jgi:hypothetical protein
MPNLEITVLQPRRDEWVGFADPLGAGSEAFFSV